jgi:hypothetical protein
LFCFLFFFFFTSCFLITQSWDMALGTFSSNGS